MSQQLTYTTMSAATCITEMSQQLTYIYTTMAAATCITEMSQQLTYTTMAAATCITEKKICNPLAPKCSLIFTKFLTMAIIYIRIFNFFHFFNHASLL